ncbi:hypothetical protein [Pedobacter ureilyticus]|uniref:DUF805 domain-containing protein n=1 Tax=Pedobacter ureilyticus TaxID=1393051 RepID=A0ABW9J4Q2_9SPHI|nr:hypothetical protein [Pedobacter helvus]
MPEILLLCFMLIPQLVAGVYAHSIGKSFWFWFFISFLIPIISLIVLLIIDSKKPKNPTQEKSSYQLADHVIERQEGRRE